VIYTVNQLWDFARLYLIAFSLSILGKKRLLFKNYLKVNQLNIPKKRYLTRRAITQRVGLTEGSIDTLNDIAFTLQTMTDITYSRPMIIRRAIEVYASHLLGLYSEGLLHTELDELDGLKGQRGRRATI